MTTATDVVAQAVRGATEFTDAMMAEFGGPVAMAKELHLEYEAHPRGAPVRERIINCAVRLLERYGTSVDDSPAKLEALDQELATLLEEEARQEAEE